MSTVFDARARELLMNLGQELVNTGRWKKKNSPTGVQFTQLNDRWSCINCGIDGSTAAIPYYSGESQRLSVGVRTKAKPSIMFSSAFCVNCTKNLKQSTLKTDQVIYEMLSKYLEEHRHFEAYTIGKSWNAPTPLKQTKTRTRNVAPRAQTAGGKARGRPLGSKNRSNALFSFVENESSYSQAPQTPVMQSHSEGICEDVIPIELGSVPWPDLFEIPNFHLPPTSENAVPQINESVTDSNNSSFDRMPVIPRLLLEDITNPVEQEFNFALLNYADALTADNIYRVPAHSVSISPSQFLLISDPPSERKIQDSLHSWLNFVLFFLHQCRANDVSFLSFTGEPAFFELQDVPTFTAQSVQNTDFNRNIQEYTKVLKSRGSKAVKEKKDLDQLVASYFPSEVEFSELFCFLLDSNFFIREEARLFSRYFFRFPDRLKAMYNFDSYEFLNNIQSHEIAGYKCNGKMFVPNLSIQPKHAPAKLKIRTSNAL